MDEAASTLIVGLIGLLGVVFTALVSYRQGQLRVRQDLEIEYDRDLRARRIEHYLQLWAILAPLAKYPRPAALDPEDVEGLAVQAKRWYFEGGGLFLSHPTRGHYFDLLDACRTVMEKRAARWPEEWRSAPPTDEALRAHYDRAEGWHPPGALRSIAAADLGPPDEPLPDGVGAHLRALGSALRAGMTGDVLTREETVLRRRRVRAHDG